MFVFGGIKFFLGTTCSQLEFSKRRKQLILNSGDQTDSFPNNFLPLKYSAKRNEKIIIIFHIFSFKPDTKMI